MSSSITTATPVRTFNERGIYEAHDGSRWLATIAPGRNARTIHEEYVDDIGRRTWLTRPGTYYAKNGVDLALQVEDRIRADAEADDED